ncbi:hypothetical protein DFA_12136 [Cavenderia fasciculata]|uniref:Uncharacterized protein n=1 Tax=Cavenderia fasciculata TaxID=261658 RepID=F4QC83_CACFS|nr:uncharacterized protein DFA_12136 [Cavenderia fasciculata]EGG14364.1 hypothetical protein DFA_12136 [Cavenderia fasciculata]|eukprot:XP_004351088.1 hypothetical protein DFA_12136 [Cavenderia fasciculata]
MTTEIETHRINSLIEDITILRLDCDWVNDQTEQSFRSILEKGSSNFLFLELICSIGKELSVYFENINITDDLKNNAQLLKESFGNLLKSTSYNGSIDQIFSSDSDDKAVAIRLSMFEHVFFQLQSIQLELFQREYTMQLDQDNNDEKNSTKMRMSTDSTTTADTEMSSDQDDFQGDLINKIQILSEIFQIRFNNFDNFLSILNSIYLKIENVLKQLPKDFISEPFFKNVVFSDEEKQKIEAMSKILFADYDKRSEVLCKRLDVTVQSLMWSDKVQHQMDEINWHINYQREIFPSIHYYTFQDLICTHSDILDIIKTCLQSKSTGLTKQIIVGTVPDRGGRTTDRRPAMPSFHKRVEHPQDSFHHRKKSKK